MEKKRRSHLGPAAVTRMEAVKPYTITWAPIIYHFLQEKMRTTMLNVGSCGQCVTRAHCTIIKSVIYSMAVLVFPVYYALKSQLYALPWFPFCHLHNLFCAAENSLRTHSSTQEQPLERVHFSCRTRHHPLEVRNNFYFICATSTTCHLQCSAEHDSIAKQFHFHSVRIWNLWTYCGRHQVHIIIEAPMV